MRLFEASHTPEILREAGPAGLHVDSISEKNGVNKTKLGAQSIIRSIPCLMSMQRTLYVFSPHTILLGNFHRMFSL